MKIPNYDSLEDDLKLEIRLVVNLVFTFSRG